MTTRRLFAQGLAFWGLENKILYFDPIFLQKLKFWANFRRDLKNFVQKGLNNGAAHL